MFHPGRVASISTVAGAVSEWVDANTKKSGWSRATSSRLTCGQSCSESTMETAPARRRASAMKVCLPTDERLMPDNEENTFGRRRSEVLLQIRKMMFHFGGDGSACVRCAQDIGKLL